MKRIVAALQMLIFGAVGLQIRPSRDNTFSFVAFFMLVCSVSLLNSCGVPYEAYIYVKNETADTLYVALEHESRYYKLDNDSGQWRHYYYTFREIASGEKEFMHEMYKDERDDKQKLYVIKKSSMGGMSIEEFAKRIVFDYTHIFTYKEMLNVNFIIVIENKMIKR